MLHHNSSSHNFIKKNNGGTHSFFKYPPTRYDLHKFLHNFNKLPTAGSLFSTNDIASMARVYETLRMFTNKS